jgi:cobaltochelatase CobN
MHLLRTQAISLDEADAAVDLDQSPAEIVILSFSDNDLGAVAAAWNDEMLPGLGLRLASLAKLRHPYSVDTYVAKLAPKARFVLVRLLGGLDYWRYGIDEWAAAARNHRFDFAALPGHAQEDARLDAASTLAPEDLRCLSAYFQHGGADNIRNMLAWIGDRLEAPRIPQRSWQLPAPVPAAGLLDAACRQALPERGKALILLYRAALLAGDVAPHLALAESLQQRGLTTTAVFATSLKDPAAADFIGALIDRERPDIILNTTSFSAHRDDGGTILDRADAPVLQVILAGGSEEQWQASRRGLSAADLAMNIVLPEMDGRIITRAISCKAEAETNAGLEFTRVIHRPLASRIAFVADLATAWVDLRRKSPARRRIACILSDYPAKQGRTGYAVGLDTPASVAEIAKTFAESGYKIDHPIAAERLIADLKAPDASQVFSFAAYEAALAALPPAFVKKIYATWGDPRLDQKAAQDGFHFAALRNGHMIVALQPDRGNTATRKSDYHDVDLPPCHAYVAFYLWLRKEVAIDAMIHCGTHGTLEWLPGKAIALDVDCAPEAVLGPVPVVYPFIVNNPGEAAQAKRRIAAVTIGHMTPPLTKAGSHGAALELEALFDEYAAAEALDPRRARILAKLILERAFDSGLAQDSGIDAKLDPNEALNRLDAWLCDIKDMRIADGLHVFGRMPAAERRHDTLVLLHETQTHTRPNDGDDIAARFDACAKAERQALLAALDGRFVAPGPAGAPSRGRLDVLPTGRNLYTIDPRGVPTRTAWDIGQRTAREVMARYAQDHGEWPRRIVIDLWGSAMMRTGGDDLAQAFALMGVRPVWDHGSSRINGFEILPSAKLEWPRVDVTLRISGLFRDVFPTQIALFDEAVAAVAALDEDEETNPLATEARQGRSTARIFGGAPGSYGIGLLREHYDGGAPSRVEMGEAYLAASAYAYGARDESRFAAADFRTRVATAQAFVHVQDMEEQDILQADAFAEHEGGFAAAAAGLGSTPAVYHADSSRIGQTKVRSLTEEIARVIRGRAANPRWIAGQMRHGHRGAAEMAETIDNLFAYALLTDAVASHHFDLVYDATLGDPAVRDFLLAANPAAARAIAACLNEAAQRGHWHSRRNSTLAEINALLESCA